METWKPIKGYEGFYEVSDEGRVKSLKKWDVNKRSYADNELIMSPTDNGNGYMIVGLRNGSKKKNHYVHRLVADAFVDNPRQLNCVNHKDRNQKNNKAKNLEWCTQKENVLYSVNMMKHRKSISHTNTGEMYISKRKSNGRYRVVVSKIEYGSYTTLREAIQKRDVVLKGGD